jgi:hypothetical protein
MKNKVTGKENNPACSALFGHSSDPGFSRENRIYETHVICDVSCYKN